MPAKTRRRSSRNASAEVVETVEPSPRRSRSSTRSKAATKSNQTTKTPKAAAKKTSSAKSAKTSKRKRKTQEEEQEDEEEQENQQSPDSSPPAAKKHKPESGSKSQAKQICDLVDSQVKQQLDDMKQNKTFKGPSKYLGGAIESICEHYINRVEDRTSMLLENQRQVLRQAKKTPKTKPSKSKAKSSASKKSSSSSSSSNKDLLKEQKNLRRVIAVMETEMQEWKKMEEAFDEGALRSKLSGAQDPIDVEATTDDQLPAILNSYQLDLLRGQCTNLLSDQLKSTLQTMTLSTDTMNTLVNSMQQANNDTQTVMKELVAHYNLQAKTKAKGGSGRTATTAHKLIRGITKAGKKK